MSEDELPAVPGGRLPDPAAGALDVAAAGTLVARARAGIHEWINRSGRTLKQAGPQAIVTMLTAAALAPVVVPLLGVSAGGAAVAGLLAQLGNVGAEHVHRMLQDLVARLGSESRSGAGAEETVRAILERQLEAGLAGPAGAGLGAEMTSILRAVNGVGTALDAAFHSDIDGLTNHISQAIHTLGDTVAEFRSLRDDVLTALLAIQCDITGIAVTQQTHTDWIQRISMQITMLHRQIAVNRPAVAVAAPAAPPAALAAPVPPGAAPSEICPYPGLAAFNERDAPWFHGRERLVAEIITRLRQRLRFSAPLIVSGASGAGKSSLLHAGLIPGFDSGALAVPGSAHWPREIMTPGRYPLRDLALRLSRLAGLHSGMVLDELAEEPGRAAMVIRQGLLAHREPRIPGAAGSGAGAGAGDAASRRLVLVVDQFEEVFTLCSGTERRKFIDAICAAAEGSAQDPAPALVVIGLRAGFIEHCTAHPALGPALRDPFLVGPMNVHELRSAINEPARDRDLTVETGLAATMLNDLEAATPPGDGDAATYDPGKLPLLAHALRETWERREDGVLTISAYNAAGGIKQAVAKKADEVYGGFDEDSRRVARILLENLVAVRADAEDTRRRMPRGALLEQVAPADAKAAARVLDRLERERLVTADQDTVQIAHEALLRHWPLLSRWLEEHRAWLRELQRLTERAREWDEGGRHPALLLPGVQLSAAHEQLDGARRAELGALEAAYLRASERRRTRTSRTRQAVALTVTVLIAALAASAVVVQNSRSTARRQQAIALSRQLVGDANTWRDSNPEVSMLYALEAYRVAPDDEAAIDGLLSTQAGYVTDRVESGAGPVNAVAYDPDPDPAAPLLAAADQDGAVTLWDTAALEPVATLRGRAGSRSPFYAVAFDPSGRRLAGAQQDGTIVLWDTATRRQTALVAGLGDAVTTLAFSPDGRTLATAGYDGTVTLRQADTLRAYAALHVGNGTISSVAFSPDGSLLAAACTDGQVRVWNTAAPSATPSAVPLAFTGHTGLVRAVAFSPDGTLLASGGDDATVRLWDVRTRATRGVLTTAANPVRTVAFSPDGSQLAAGGENDVVRLWDVRTRLQVSTLTGLSDTVAGVAFSPDGRTLAAAGADATVDFWNVAAPSPPGGTAVTSVAVSAPEGGRLATSGTDPRTGQRQTGLWRLAGRSREATLPVGAAAGQAGAALPGGDPGTGGIAFSPDGQVLAASADKTGIVLWDVAARHEAGMLATPSYIKTLAYRPTGAGPDRVLAVGAANDSIYLWGPGAVQPQRPISQLNGPINAVAWSPDGTLLAAGSDDGTILLVKVSIADGKPAAAVETQLLGHSGPVESVAFSPDGHTLAGGSADGTIRLWDTRHPDDPNAVSTLTGHSQTVVGLAFSSDARVLASSGGDDTIRLWDVRDPASPTTLATLTGLRSATAVAFEPGSHVVVGAEADGTALFWDGDPGEVARRICAAGPAAAARILAPSLLGAGYPPLCPPS
jgi:WD40 repeat protein